MREIVRMQAAECMPRVADIAKSQGLKSYEGMRAAIRETLDQAMKTYLELASPVGILADVTVEDFARIFEGEGKNTPATPLGAMFPKAKHLALFAATLGPATEKRISELFEQGRFDSGYLLDAVASEAADRAGERVEKHFQELWLSGPERVGLLTRRYGPGYCGWHVSGQGRLFDFLKPEAIGMRLNASYLMQPLKSVSGVIVAGNPGIHRFAPEFEFCAECRARECRAGQE